MKTLTTFLLVLPLFSILTVHTVRAQTEEEFQQEFQAYMNQHGLPATGDYVIARMAQMTTQTALQQSAWALIERSFGITPCLASKQQRCDQDFEQRLAQLTTNSAVSAAACVAAGLAGGSPVATLICLSAVALRHAIELESARNAHMSCYLRARTDCATPTPSPTPNHCSILSSDKAGKDENDGESLQSRDIVPLIADCSLYEDPCLCPPSSPIMIDVAGDGFDLTNVDDGVMFDITGFGREPLGWSRANSDDAFLALDLNGNGFIDNGLELFGNFTYQPEPAAGGERNGFAALAIFDYNADGKIDDADTVYPALRLWQDKNHNGVSEADELQRLNGLGLRTLFLNYKRSKRIDRYGNEFRYRAKVDDLSYRQRGRWAWDVFLVSSRPRPTSIGGPRWTR